MSDRPMCHDCIPHPQGGTLLCPAHARSGSGTRIPVVEIHVQGGVAYVVRKDAGVRIILRDFDNDPKDGDAERHAAPCVIEDGRPIATRRG